MHFDNLLGDGQSEPRAPLGPGARTVYLMELVEDALTLFMRDAGAGIADAHNKATVLGSGRDAYLAGVREFDGVADQIEQNLGAAWRGADAMTQALGHLGPEGELVGGGERLGCHTHRLDHAVERVFTQVQFELARLDLGNVEHGVDQTKQMLAVGLHALDDADG